MLRNIINTLEGEFASDDSKISKELKKYILKEAREIADMRDVELNDSILKEVASKMISAGDFLEKVTSPLDYKWKLNEIVNSEFCAKCGSCEIVCPNDLIAFEEKPILIDECKRDGHGMCHEVCPRVSSGRYQISLRENFFENYYSGKGNVKGQDGGVVTTSKSKYSISPLSALKKAGELGLEKVAVVGLPCQIEGLRKVQYHSYLSKHSSELGDNGKPANLPKIEYLIGLFCTEKFDFETIEKILEDNNLLIEDVEKFDVSKGKFIIKTSVDTIKIPVKDIKMASGCNLCRDFAAELADISVGSVGSEDGFSTVIIRTKKGEEIKNCIDLKEDIDKLAIDKLKDFKMNRFKKSIGTLLENEEFISYYWNDACGGIGKRADDNYFVRIRAKPSGWYDVEDAEYINEIVKEYEGRIKLTNRGAYEIHDIKPIDLEEVVKKLDEHNLTTGSEGPLVRASLACPGEYNCPFGLINTTDLCYTLEDKFSEFPTNYKFKIAINGCPNKCSRPQLHDFGIVGVKYPITNPENCNGCGRCEDVCKVEALSIRGDMSYTNYNVCIGCGKCFKACPHDAKDVKKENYMVYIGGKSGREVISLECSSVDEIVDLLQKVIVTYNKLAIKPQKERLASTMRRVGQAKFMEEVNKI